MFQFLVSIGEALDNIRYETDVITPPPSAVSISTANVY